MQNLEKTACMNSSPLLESCYHEYKLRLTCPRMEDHKRKEMCPRQPALSQLISKHEGAQPRSAETHN